MINTIAYQFKMGGSFMWVILGVLAFALAIVIERIVAYFVINKVNGIHLVNQIIKLLEENRVDDAIELTNKNRPKENLIKIILQNYKDGSDVEAIEEAMEEGAIKEVPKLSKRLNYLSLAANVSTLLGLLGTIAGLQVSFSSLAGVEAAKKAVLLASGISQAMNTTAFGLIVAVPCMIFFTWLSNRKDALINDLDEAVVRLINYIKRK